MNKRSTMTGDEESRKGLLGADSLQALQKLSSSIKEQLRSLEDSPEELELKFKSLTASSGIEHYRERIRVVQEQINSAESYLPALTSNKVYWEKMVEKYENERKSLELVISKKHTMISQMLSEKQDRENLLGGSPDGLRKRGKVVSNLVEEGMLINESNRMTQEAVSTGVRILESAQRQNDLMMRIRQRLGNIREDLSKSGLMATLVRQRGAQDNLLILGLFLLTLLVIFFCYYFVRKWIRG